MCYLITLHPVREAMLLSFADKKLKHREFRQFVLGHTASKWQMHGSNTDLTPKLMLLITMFYFSCYIIKTKVG